MRNKIRFSAYAQRDIADLHDYLSAHSTKTADAIIADLERILMTDIAINPVVYGWFYLLHEPFRARLFRVSRRTQFWIIYEYSEATRLVLVHRLWNASRNPSAFEL
ncbi:MAG: type II toxin-antitoxin system RelE/ParE family toxin [Beijerinckiaceae bacterium]